MKICYNIFSKIYRQKKSKMGLFSFIKPKTDNKTQKHYLAMDLGTETVKCLVIKNVFSDHKGYIIGAGEQSLPTNSNLAGQILDIHAYVDTIQNAIEKAVTLSGLKPNDVIAGISGPKIINQINRQTFTRSKPHQKITTEELQIIFRQVENQSKKTLRSLQTTGKIHDQLELVNAAMLKIMIDGVEVQNPLGFTGRDLDITYFVSYAPSIQLNALQSVIDECKLNLVSIINEPYSLLKSIDAGNHFYKNSLFIDIGGDLTNIGLIQDGQISYVGSFQSGGRQFTNILAENLSISFKKAEQYKLDYSHNLMSEETEQEFKSLFLPQSEKWLSTLLDYLNNLELDLNVSQIFVCGGGSLLPEIKSLLKNKLSPQKIFKANSDLHYLKPTDLENIIDKTTYIKSSSQIVPLSLGKIGLKFSAYDNPFEKMIKKLMQTLRT